MKSKATECTCKYKQLGWDTCICELGSKTESHPPIIDLEGKVGVNIINFIGSPETRLSTKREILQVALPILREFNESKDDCLRTADQLLDEIDSLLHDK